MTAPTYSEMLDTAKTNLASIIANPKPSYSQDGVTYNWNQYQTVLMNQIDFLEKKVKEEEEGPFEIDQFAL